MKTCKTCKHFIGTGKSFGGSFADGGMCDCGLSYCHTGCDACQMYEESQHGQMFCDSLVYVCSPYNTGNIEFNVNVAQKLCRYVFDCGYIPVATHLYFPQFMNDEIPKERETAIKICK